MATFNDRDGQSWIVDLNVTSLKKLKKSGYDLLDGLESGESINRLMQDPIYLVDVIYVLCESQAEKRNISDEDFGRLVGKGDMIEAATEALIEEMTLFFRSRGETIKLAMKKFKTVEERLNLKARTAIEGIDIDEIESRFGKSLASSLVSSELTQDPSPSES